MSKKNSILIVLLIIQLAFIGYAYRPGQNTKTALPAFYSDIKLEQIKEVQITDDENSSITLKKNAENWLVEPGSYPGATDSIQSILRKIIALQPARLVTKTKSSQVQLKISASTFNRKIKLKLKGDSVRTFYLGSSPSNKSIHFRLAGEDDVYIVKDLSSWELQTDKESWWHTAYIDINQADLTSFSIQNSSDNFTFKKDTDDNWQIKGQLESELNIDQKAVSDLVGTIKKISISEYLSKEKPTNLDTPIGVIEYKLKDTTQELEIWPTEDEDGSHVVKASDQDFFANVRAYILKDVLDAKLSGLTIVPQDKPVAE